MWTGRSKAIILWETLIHDGTTANIAIPYVLPRNACSAAATLPAWSGRFGLPVLWQNILFLWPLSVRDGWTTGSYAGTAATHHFGGSRSLARFVSCFQRPSAMRSGVVALRTAIVQS